MVALLQKLVGYGSWAEWRYPTPTINNTPPAADPMVGKFRADYSLLTPEQIAQEDEELTELYANSRRVSR